MAEMWSRSSWPLTSRATPKPKIEWMSLPSNQRAIMKLAFAGKNHPAMKMAGQALSMSRAPNQVFVLLVGLTGAGKSSTINYLFDKTIAKTNENRSETHSTIEYIVNLTSTEWKIPDLKLSVIDTPGLGDTGGLEQDAKNILSIKYFLKSHPSLKGNYPNLVMIVLNINDNRIDGDSSNFAKMLKGICTINAIDLHNPNVVVVLTHAASIGTNPSYWIETVERIKMQVKALVKVHLGIYPETVVQENQPKAFNLEREGDWYLLPNDDKQPKILYQACASVLNRAKDEIGHEAIAVCFRPTEDQEVSTGLVIASSDSKAEDVSNLYMDLCKTIVMIPTSEIAKMLDTYKQQQTEQNLCQDILILQVRFRDLEINSTAELQEMTLNSLMALFYPIRINIQMQKVLQEVFGISYEQSAGFDYHVGKGYNIFKDTATQFSPLLMVTDAKSGHGLPENVSLKDCSSCEIKCESIEDANDYIRRRLRELKIDIGADIDFGAFNFQPQYGYNTSKKSRNSKTKTLHMSSFSIEQRIQKVEVQPPYQITDVFKADIKALPEDYDMDDESSVLKWKAFFDKWGMYVVTGAFIGGSLTGQAKVVNQESVQSTTSATEMALSMKMALLQNVARSDSPKIEKEITMMKDLSTIQSTSLKWSGGIRKTYKKFLEEIEQNDWQAWEQSLQFSSVPLWSSLDLYPLYHLVSEVCPKKSIKMQQVMNLALNGKFTYSPPKEDNRTNTATSNDSSSCFHEDASVILHNQEIKRMKDLSIGDKILTVDRNGTYAQDEVIAWLHQVRDGQFRFLQIVHVLGKIILSPEHIIFVGKSRNPQHASTLKPGDELCFSIKDDNLQTVAMSEVLSIHQVERRGIYAPLTYSGCLLVDKIEVSCYCTLKPLKVVGKQVISSHALAHAGFFPLRMASKFGLKITSQLDKTTGIHSYALWLMHVILGK